MEVWPEAKTKAQQAIAMDPALAAAHTSLALALSEYEWDFPAAEREHREAIRLSPGDSRARYFYGLHLMLMGRLAEARREMSRALELDPLSKQALCGLAYTHYYAGSYDEALRECRRTIALDSAYFETYGCLGLTLAAVGRQHEAIGAFQEADRLTGGELPLARAFLSYALGIAGKAGEARDVLDGVYAASEHRYIPPAYLAVGEIGLGNSERAFAALEDAFAAKDGTLLYLRILPVFDPLRNDPRFEALCRRVALPVPNSPATSAAGDETRTWSASHTDVLRLKGTV
jgi:tetratricopeptide (TPR) repeat protein